MSTTFQFSASTISSNTERFDGFAGGETTVSASSNLSGAIRVFRTGERIVSPEDYSLSGQVITLTQPLNAGEWIIIES